MNAEAILIKIEEDAKEAAARIAGEARVKAEALTAASREKIEGMHKAALSQAERDAAEMEQRMLRMAELDDRKALLGKKRALIDETFVKAGELLLAAPAAQRRALFLGRIAACAGGTETLSVGALGADWFDGNFLTDANAALAAVGKPAGLTLAADRRPDCAGVVLTQSGAEIHCTLDAFLEEARADMEQPVATELFGEP
ncbi:MAG: hypothetical protein GX418_02175 [Clostridiales bacterium]|nr:hypothetical protein [Clostridiales bacterium]